MYSRSYPNPGEALIPPNYSGNAFDLAREKQGRFSEQKGHGENRRIPQSEHQGKNQRQKQAAEIPQKEGKRSPSPVKKEHTASISNSIASLFSRRDGKRIESDDILLAGLIILLISSGADEEIILLLGFLFLAGL